MKLNLTIAPDTVKPKKGWFAKPFPIHKLTIDLQLTEEEKATVKRLGILGRPLLTQDPEAMGHTVEVMMGAYPDTGGRPYLTLAGIVFNGFNTASYMTLVDARKALETAKEEMIALKALLENADNPANDSFSL